MSGHAARKRPSTVTLVIWGVILFGVWHGGSAVALGRQRDLLLTLAARPDPRLRLVFAVIWSGLWLLLAWALWQRRPYARWAVPFFLGLHGVYTLTLWLVYSQTPPNWPGWLLTGAFYAGASGFAAWALNRAAAASYFQGASHERGDASGSSG